MRLILKKLQKLFVAQQDQWVSSKRINMKKNQKDINKFKKMQLQKKN